MRNYFKRTIPMAIRRQRLAWIAGITASRFVVGDVDPNGIVLKEGVT